MSRKDTYDLIREAGFLPGEFDQSRHVRGRVCNGVASPEDLLAYEPFSAKWNEYARLTAERDQADAREAAAPDPTRHDADQSGGLGSALADLRAGQAGRRLTVVRPRMISVDVSGGKGGMMDIPEPEQWPQYRGSAGSGGHEKIAAGLSAAEKKR